MKRAPPLLLGLALIAGAALAQAAPGSPIRKRTAYEDLQMFSQVLNQIRVNHPDSIDTHDLFMAAVTGMVHAADPHSYVLPATRLVPEKEEAVRAGRLYPVPISFAFYGGSPVVVSVAPGSAAARLDILPGDELMASDSQPIQAESAEELEIGLAGPKGSTVALRFERRRLDGSLVTLERTVSRERVDEETAVPTAFMLRPEIGYIRLTTFANDKAADDLHAALGRLERLGMRRLILDLRDNGGGSVDEAARVAGEFLPKGAVVYTQETRKKAEGDKDTVRVSRSFWKHEKRYPLIVMINSGTASASELVAGALQDHDRAIIVGRPSFGKALLMRGLPLTDGSLIMLVVGHVVTPCGRVIQRQYRGITRRDYFRLARAERDTAGRPSCKTDGGRTVYGGGGIYPDVVLSEPEPAPLWLERAREDDLPLKWIGGYVSSAGASLPSLDSLAAHPALPAAALESFRTFAKAQGDVIPPDADDRLQRVLTRSFALAKWGEEGFYRVVAASDPAVTTAAQQFDRASAILTATKEPD
ncbi:MAG TPA: S41 family peptidase [Gemmatimonadales bacterium]|nr:S41 family peptidase [Gemmatimonadales bacterium]